MLKYDGESIFTWSQTEELRRVGVDAQITGLLAEAVHIVLWTRSAATG